MSNPQLNQSFEVFISYYQKSGLDFAENLKAGLKDSGISAFRDIDDIPKTIKEETDEWRSFVDNCLKNSQNFFLIMTFGFNKRPEVLRELKLALETHKQMYFFRHSDLDYRNLDVDIDGKRIELSKYEIISFENSNDLLRRALGALYNRVTKGAESFFTKEAKSKVASEGQQFKSKNIPMVEVLVGSSNPVEEWLTTTQENAYLVSHFQGHCEIISRRKYFECKNQDHFLKVDTKGFIHAIMPLREEQNTLYIDSIAREVFSVIVYAMRLFNFRNYSNPTSILVILRNCSNKRVDFWDNLLSIRTYAFSSEDETEFSFEFDPKSGWGEIGQLFLKIFRELCSEIGCNSIQDATIKQRVHNIIEYMEELRTEYRGNVIIPRVDLNAFGV